MIAAPEGRWWLDEGADSGVWPCDVLSMNVFGVRVRPTHDGSMYFGETIVVPRNRVHDNAFNHPTRTPTEESA